MWQPPMEGEDMDEMGSGTEQQQQPLVDKMKDKPDDDDAAVADTEMNADRVRAATTYMWFCGHFSSSSHVITF